MCICDRAGVKQKIDDLHEMERVMNGWIDDLIWCPSQCYKTVYHIDMPYTLYLRWRHEDPWQGHIWRSITADVLAFGGRWDNGNKLGINLFEFGPMGPLNWKKADNLDAIKASLEWMWNHRPPDFNTAYF